VSAAVERAVRDDDAVPYVATPEGRMAYREGMAAVRERFAADLAEEHLAGVPAVVAASVFRKAWEDGHASGYRAVADVYEDLADLVTLARSLP
jgi:hypothetical protein